MRELLVRIPKPAWRIIIGVVGVFLAVLAISLAFSTQSGQVTNKIPTPAHDGTIPITTYAPTSNGGIITNTIYVPHHFDDRWTIDIERCPLFGINFLCQTGDFDVSKDNYDHIIIGQSISFDVILSWVDWLAISLCGVVTVSLSWFSGVILYWRTEDDNDRFDRIFLLCFAILMLAISAASEAFAIRIFY